jgi:hypothetical protein
MKEIRYTLLADGPSDRALIPILTWLLREYYPNYAIQAEWADLRRLPRKPESLAEKIERSVDLYPCDILFVQRDAEKQTIDSRKNEIREAIELVAEFYSIPTTINVIPIRMQEAWLLFDESAIRKASGNPNGQETLCLPHLNKIERLPNPKRILYDLLRKASGLSGRRLSRLQVNSYAPRVSEFINSFAPLRALSAFNALESDIQTVMGINGEV